MRLIPAGHQAPESWANGVLHPGKWRGLRVLGWGMALVLLLFGGVKLTGYLMRPAHTAPWLFVHVEIAVAVGLALYVAAVRWGERRPVTELAPGGAVSELAIGLLFGFALFSAVMLILVAAGGYTLSAPHVAPAWTSLTLSLESGVMEELLFRGILFRLLWGALGLRWALGVSAAVFGLMHLLNPDHSLMGALDLIIEAGLLLAALYVVTGRLFASIGCHFAWNFTQGYVFGVQVSGTPFGASVLHAQAVPGASIWLTGGDFGPEASAPAVLAGLLTAIALIAWHLRHGKRRVPS